MLFDAFEIQLLVEQLDVLGLDHAPIASGPAFSVNRVLLLSNELCYERYTQYKFLCLSSPNNQTLENSGKQHN